VDVSDDLQEIDFRVEEDGLVATAEEGAVAVVGAVEALGIEAAEVPHDPGKVGVRSLEEQVEMGRHTAVGVNANPPSLGKVLEQLHKADMIGLIQEGRSPGEATVHYVVDGVRIEDPQGAAHPLTINVPRPAGDDPFKSIEVSIQDLTPIEDY